MSKSNKYSVQNVGRRDSDGAILELLTEVNGNQRLVLTLGADALKQVAFHRSGLPEPEGLREPRLIAEYVADAQSLITYPCSTRPNKYIFEPKYPFATVTFERQPPLQHYANGTPHLVLGLPTGFDPNPFEGCGLYYPLRFIFQAFDQVEGIKDVTMCHDDALSFEDGVVRFPISTYNVVRTAINRAHKAALDFAMEEKLAYLRGELLPGIMPEANIQGTFRRSAHDLDRILTNALIATGRQRRATTNAVAAVRSIRSATRAVIKDSPAEIFQLNREIELVTLEGLIALLEEKLDKTLPEKYWQKLLVQNPFILKLAFGLPVAVFGEQVSVGGTDFKGKGGKLADFLVDSGLLGNLAVIEIKRPSTKILQKDPYREGLYAPSREVVGSVNQVLDQRFQLQQSINNKKIDSRTFDVFAYAVQCIVIVGLRPDQEDQQKSFELFRNNLRDVVVITFDELLEKLKALYEFLQANPLEDATQIDPGIPGDEELQEEGGDDLDYDEDDYEDFIRELEDGSSYLDQLALGE